MLGPGLSSRPGTSGHAPGAFASLLLKAGEGSWVAWHFSGQFEGPAPASPSQLQAPPFCQLLACGPRSMSRPPRAQGKWLVLSAFGVGSDSFGCGATYSCCCFTNAAVSTSTNLISSFSYRLLSSDHHSPCPPRPRPMSHWLSENQLIPGHEWMLPIYWSSAGKLALPWESWLWTFPVLVTSFVGFLEASLLRRQLRCFVDIVPSS